LGAEQRDGKSGVEKRWVEGSYLLRDSGSKLNFEKIGGTILNLETPNQRVRNEETEKTVQKKNGEIWSVFGARKRLARKRDARKSAKAHQAREGEPGSGPSERR